MFITFLVVLYLGVLANAASTKLIGTSSLATCMINSTFSASIFNAVYTPNNNSASIVVAGVSTFSGNVNISLSLEAYGIKLHRQVIDPCVLKFNGLCPMSPGPLDLDTVITIPPKIDNQIKKRIPLIAYLIPDIDGVIQVSITSNGVQVGCVETFLFNGKTVEQSGVSWSIAVIAGLAIFISAFMSGLGHSSTAAHVAAVTLALFAWFQTQAIYGMTAVNFPPIARSWVQNFQWSMGVIRLRVMQNVFTWYIKSTGGKPSQYLNAAVYSNVVLRRRSIIPSVISTGRQLFRRQALSTSPATATIFRGIKRVAYRSRIEPSNLFMTCYSFFILLLFIVSVGILFFKGILQLIKRMGKLPNNRFAEFRAGWRTVFKGIVYRILFVGYSQMTVLCLWELTQRDSVGAVINSIVMFIALSVCLLFASWKVIRLARRSIALHKSPAYILFSDPQQLNRWGFIYIQFRANCYWFVLVIILGMLLRGGIIAFMQGAPEAQAICLLILELAFLVLVSWQKPYMNRSTNLVGISMAAINFALTIILLFFSGVFHIKSLAISILGIAYFVISVVYSLILLVFVIFSCIYALTHKNPDEKYALMRDDRVSYIKNAPKGANGELDALAANMNRDSLPYNKNFNSAPLAAGGGDMSGLNSPDNFGHISENKPDFGRQPKISTPILSTQGRKPVNQTTPITESSTTNTLTANTRNANKWKRGIGYDKE